MATSIQWAFPLTTRQTRETPETSSRRTAASGTTAAPDRSPTRMWTVPKRPIGPVAAAPGRSTRTCPVKSAALAPGRTAWTAPATGARPPASSTVAFWPGPDAGQVRLRDIGEEDERGGVGNGQDLLVLRDAVAGARGVRDDGAVPRGDQGPADEVLLCQREGAFRVAPFGRGGRLAQHFARARNRRLALPGHDRPERLASRDGVTVGHVAAP